MLYGDITNQLQYLVKTVQPPLVKVETTLTNVPKFEVGQQLPATVMASLPNGKFHVAVPDYGTLEMTLPPNTKKGDNVELIVYQNSPKLTFILNSQNGKSTIPAEVEKQLYQNNPQLANSKASLSSAATTISQLLSRQVQVMQNQQFIQNVASRQIQQSEHKETGATGLHKSSESPLETKGSSHSKSGVHSSTTGGDPFSRIQKQGDGYAQGEQDKGSHDSHQQAPADQGRATKTLGFQIRTDQTAQLSRGAEAAEHLHHLDKPQDANQTQKVNFANQTQNLQQVNNPFTTGMTRLENFQQKILNNPLYRSAQIVQSQAISNEVPISEGITKLAQQMQNSIERSGLFYESHLLDWVNDRRSLGDILYEPQSQLELPELPEQQATVATETSNQQTQATQNASVGGKLSEILENVLTTAEEQYHAKVMEEMKSQVQTEPQLIHDEATHLVQQQLTLIDNPNQVHWQGQIWPGQEMSWAIKRDLPEGENDNTPEESQHRQWRSEMRLDMESLGHIVGKVTYHDGRIKLEIHTKNEESAMLMKENMSILQDRLAIADITVLDMKIIVHDK